MDIKLQWQNPISLRDWADVSLIYNCDLRQIAERPGIYVFAREHGKSVSPLYIGRANNLRTRIKQQLDFTRLMKGVSSSLTGRRILLTAVLEPKRGQRIPNLLKIVESAYIENALSEGHELLNMQGTKIPSHTITSGGTKKSHKPFPRNMKHKIKK